MPHRLVGLRGAMGLVAGQATTESFEELARTEGMLAAYLEELQRLIAGLPSLDVPTLEVSPEARVASLRWRFEPAPKALDAAVRILTSVRQTPPSVTFWADPED